MLETVKDLDFEPIEFLPVAAMWLTTVYMSDYEMCIRDRCWQLLGTY